MKNIVTLEMSALEYVVLMQRLSYLGSLSDEAILSGGIPDKAQTINLLNKFAEQGNNESQTKASA